MEHLTLRSSWFELSNTLLTLPQACHGCQQHSKHTDSVCASGKPFKFHYQKNMFIRRFYKTLYVCHLPQFDKFYSLAPQKHHTGKNILFGHFFHHKLLKTRIISSLCDTVFTRCSQVILASKRQKKKRRKMFGTTESLASHSHPHL